METSVRTELHKIIDEVSEQQLQEIYDWINNGMSDATFYSPEDIAEFYSILDDHEKGLGKSYSAEETFANVRRRP